MAGERWAAPWAQQDGNTANKSLISVTKPTFRCGSLSLPCDRQLLFPILLFTLRIVVSFLFLVRVLIEGVHQLQEHGVADKD